MLINLFCSCLSESFIKVFYKLHELILRKLSYREFSAQTQIKEVHTSRNKNVGIY